MTGETVRRWLGPTDADAPSAGSLLFRAHSEGAIPGPRLLGHIAERLFDAWLHVNGVSYGEERGDALGLALRP